MEAEIVGYKVNLKKYVHGTLELYQTEFNL